MNRFVIKFESQFRLDPSLQHSLPLAVCLDPLLFLKALTLRMCLAKASFVIGHGHLLAFSRTLRSDRLGANEAKPEN